MEIHELIVILGPTATGKTAFAVKVAHALNGEIISADSRQVYRGLDIGTGKDLLEYDLNGVQIPYHLIDILNPGEAYNAFKFKSDAIAAAVDIETRKHIPIICGGTGLYIETLLLDYLFNPAKQNEEFRNSVADYDNSKLAEEIEKLGGILSDEDKCNRHRLIRRLEVLKYPGRKENDQEPLVINKLFVFGIDYPREIIRQRISSRLESRLQNGMIDEVKALIDSGVSLSWLNSLGLEYRYISRFLNNDISYQDMYRQLETAIHQFAKRQSTWFRRMEKRGIKIDWIDGHADDNSKLSFVFEKTGLGK
jgi:tRNA dimethylallyltransferase